MKLRRSIRRFSLLLVDLATLTPQNIPPPPHAVEQTRKEKSMMIPKHVFRVFALGLLSGLSAVLISQCSDTVEPAPPAKISIESGNLQSSLRGTKLPEPLVVKVRTADGAVPEEAHVVFTVTEGGGAVGSGSVRVDERGVASTTYTLGSEVGRNVVRAAIEENSSKSVDFESQATNFYCPEQSDTLLVHYGTTHHLYLATRKSSLYPAQNAGGVVEIDVYPPSSTSGFAEIAGDGVFDTNIFDAAFSARGDFYVARRSFRSEILKIDTSGNISIFARLDEDLPPADLYAEITTNPSGLLVGCDAKGPFVVGCPDTLTRFAEATYPGADINSDAVAVDPREQTQNNLGEDIYFIDETTSNLMRLAMDSLTVEPRGLETVAALTSDQAANARGMVCEPDGGDVYVLVDSEDTKQIVRITPGGAVTVLYNFFDRGVGSASGIQRDLAYDEGFKRLYTVDTLNDDILIYDVGLDIVAEMFGRPESTLSTSAGSGERVGLVVLK